MEDAPPSSPPAADQSWTLLQRRRLAADSRVTVLADQYQVPADGVRTYYLLQERGGAIVVALTPEEEVVLVRQYRPPVATFLWELPAGALEGDHADPLERAKTELRQETGFTAPAWEELGALLAAPHRSTERDTYFLARGATHQAQQDLDPGEAVQVRLVPFREALAMIERGDIQTASTIVALYRAAVRLGRLA